MKALAIDTSLTRITIAAKNDDQDSIFNLRHWNETIRKTHSFL